MQTDVTEGAPIGKEKAMPEATPEEAKEQVNDGWDMFYSMPPNWKKPEPPQTTTSERTTDQTRTKSGPGTLGHGLTDENIGHKLASLLRYHIDENNIISDDDGWVLLSQVIENADAVGLSGCTEEDLLRVGNGNEHSTRGKRFETDKEGGRIRATYRHPPKGDRFMRGFRRGPPRSYGGYGGGWRSSWQSDWGRWQESDWEEWKTWKKPGFSPSPDDVQDTAWDTTKVDSTDAPTSNGSSVRADTQKDASAVDASRAATDKEPCDWEQWFTEEMEMYFWNSKTEEYFFPADAADVEEKGWARYLDSEGEKNGKVYWWHDETGVSFYEEDVVGYTAPEA